MGQFEKHPERHTGNYIIVLRHNMDFNSSLAEPLIRQLFIDYPRN